MLRPRLAGLAGCRSASQPAIQRPAIHLPPCLITEKIKNLTVLHDASPTADMFLTRHHLVSQATVEWIPKSYRPHLEKERISPLGTIV